MLTFEGPWADAIVRAEAAIAACTDKKLLKDLEAKLTAAKDSQTIDFDRILVGKMEAQSFPITNTSLLPVAWEVLLEDFAESRNLSVFPLQGVIPVMFALPPSPFSFTTECTVSIHRLRRFLFLAISDLLSFFALLAGLTIYAR